jgi:hypothetical protein
LLPLAVLALLLAVPERPGRLEPVAWRHGLILLRQNRPFRRLVLAWVCNGTANAIPATLFLLFITHVLEAPEHAGPLLLVYFGVGIAALPGWLFLARRLGKHRVWTISMLLASVIGSAGYQPALRRDRITSAFPPTRPTFSGSPGMPEGVVVTAGFAASPGWCPGATPPWWRRRWRRFWMATWPRCAPPSGSRRACG